MQKAFYSLILEQRIGELVLPKGSVVIGAGNRSQDNAITRPLPTALVNRMVHVHLEASARDWLAWAAPAGIHPMVLDYLKQRPDHLVAPPPKTEEPFSTPRSWHMLSDALYSAGPDNGQVPEQMLRVLTDGCLSPAHARQFVGWARQVAHAWDLDAVLKGTRRWPASPADRDLLYFLAQSFRARLAKGLPADKAGSSKDATQLAHRGKALVELAEISLEIAQLVVAPAGPDADGSDGQAVPDWFLIEVVRDLPRLAQARIWATSNVLAHLGFGHADPAHRDGRGSYAAEWRARMLRRRRSVPRRTAPPVPAVERRRTYARPSRRQSSTPSIPRPSRHIPEDLVTTRTFGVVLDTSGSMDNRLLGQALGAIASYATARDVRTIRVVFCDAAAYDAGWLSPEQIADRVTVRGRGGTILQPGVDLLTADPAFPQDGPILLITDGHCDHVRVSREHAWLTSGRLPFTPRGPVFRLT